MFDAIIVGGGHNGLVAAAYLAKAGRQVLVLEAREEVGGAASTAAVFPGCQVNNGAIDSGLFMPAIVRDLDLEKHGLQFIHSPAIVHALDGDGAGLTLWRDPARAQAEIRRLSPADAERFPAYCQWVRQLSSLVERMASLTLPDLPGARLGQLLPWLPVALSARRLGRRQVMEFVRALPLSVQDFLGEWFESPLLQAALGATGVSFLSLGPRASGTALMLLYQSIFSRPGEAGFRSSSFVQGGIWRLNAAIASAARSWGAEVRCQAGVTQILVKDGRAYGVQLLNGEELHARVVLSNLDPRRTLFDLVGSKHLEVRQVRQVRSVRLRGSTARLNLLLNGLPDLTGTSGKMDVERLSGHVLLCPSLDYLERAWDDAKAGRISEQPVIDLVIPTLSDPSLAPAGQHLLSANLRYAPYHLREGNWEVQQSVLLERALATLERFLPSLGGHVLDRQLLTPLDLERQFGLTEGCLTHGQMTLDQSFFMRPIAGFSRYRTPIANLYLCGSGAHPGGGVTGIPGRNAARQVLKDLRPFA